MLSVRAKPHKKPENLAFMTTQRTKQADALSRERHKGVSIASHHRHLTGSREENMKKKRPVYTPDSATKPLPQDGRISLETNTQPALGRSHKESDATEAGCKI